MNRLRGLCHRCGHVHKFPDDPDCSQVCVRCALAKRADELQRAPWPGPGYAQAAMWTGATTRAWRVVV